MRDAGRGPRAARDGAARRRERADARAEGPDPRVATSPFTVLIDGGSGTGKKLDRPRAPLRRGLAAGRSSCRSTARCSATSCSSPSSSGTQGAFTGPAPERKPLLKLSSGGTVLLDEAAELSSPARPGEVTAGAAGRRRPEPRARTTPTASTSGWSRPQDRPLEARRQLFAALPSRRPRDPPRRYGSAGRTSPASRTTTARTSPRPPAAAAPLARKTATALAPRPSYPPVDPEALPEMMEHVRPRGTPRGGLESLTVTSRVRRDAAPWPIPRSCLPHRVDILCDITYVMFMAQGTSGRVVIVVEPRLKRELYGELARRGTTLKAWFIDQATHFLETSRQPSLLVVEDVSGHRTHTSSRTPSSAEEDSE